MFDSPLILEVFDYTRTLGSTNQYATEIYYSSFAFSDFIPLFYTLDTAMHLPGTSNISVDRGHSENS